MGTRRTRSIFVAALCAGIAMVGLSVHGLLGVDADLQRSAFAAQQLHQIRVSEYRVLYHHSGDCHQGTPQAPSQRT
jgi:hypothetical protein